MWTNTCCRSTRLWDWKAVHPENCDCFELIVDTHEILLEASQFVTTLENRQGLEVTCPEEIARRHGWIDNEQLSKLATPLAKNGYGRYLLGLLKRRVC